ncbi:MAG: hypothetical protein IKD42_02930 [Kiritimatiellae bacterium]|nr:hypothetical protein [Kiritimatiellia bacterium]
MKSLKEKAVLAAFGIVLLYAATAALWFLVQSDSLKRAKKAYANAVKKYESEKKLISEKRKWFDAYESEKANMPVFEEGRSTDTTWLKRMDVAAAANYIQISSRQAGKETEAGDVLELPIEVKGWEGAWENLVKFIHAMESGGGEGMFDMRSISFRPSSKKGYLKGSFTLTCAYMRSGAVETGKERGK